MQLKDSAIANHYLDTVKEMKGNPKIIKADDGTEHSVNERLHDYFSKVIIFEHELIRRFH